MLRRNIDTVLSEWKTSRTLLVRGARQTGKTFSVMHFGKTHFNRIDNESWQPEHDSESRREFLRCSGDIFRLLSRIAN
ncbi:MAG: hypothetical protein DRI57_16435 [Deltaproteobacteria bacterium]|nr:MAG: hypothetical protein DRI57_16435 [Deltaproteobacteria bacterium]